MPGYIKYVGRRVSSTLDIPYRDESWTLISDIGLYIPVTTPNGILQFFTHEVWDIGLSSPHNSILLKSEHRSDFALYSFQHEIGYIKYPVLLSYFPILP